MKIYNMNERYELSRFGYIFTFQFINILKLIYEAEEFGIYKNPLLSRIFAKYL